MSYSAAHANLAKANGTNLALWCFGVATRCQRNLIQQTNGANTAAHCVQYKMSAKN